MATADSTNTFDKAVESCQDEGATLPIITSAEMNNFLVQMASDASNWEFWIGFQCTNSSTNSCWWIDGTLLSETGFTFFNPGSVILK